MSIDPVTAKALSLFATTGLRMAQTISASRDRQRQLSSQAAFQQQQADRARAINAARTRQLRRERSRERAAARARQSSAGISPSFGSALLLQEDAAANDRFDILLAHAIGAQPSLDADYRSRLLRMEQDAERRRGQLAVAELALVGPR